MTAASELEHVLAAQVEPDAVLDHRLLAEPPAVDVVLDAEGLDEDAQVRAIRDARDAASGA